MAQRQLVFNDLSDNFTIAKVFSILMVVMGHYFGGILWIPTTVALFVFAFSSGFFTSRKYTQDFPKKTFYANKMKRIGYSLAVINLFLLVLFLGQGKKDVFIWQTLPSMIGLNTVLEWLQIPNPSPFGRGLWFFLVLWLFYLLYPLLEHMNRARWAAIGFLLLSLIATTTLHYLVPMDYMLWITVFAFIYGAFVGRYDGLNMSHLAAILILLFSVATMVVLNIFLKYSAMNYLFILISSVALIGYLIHNPLPRWIPLGWASVLSGCLLEIYFIHPYLIIRSISGHANLNYLFSLFLIITVGYILSKLAHGFPSFHRKSY